MSVRFLFLAAAALLTLTIFAGCGPKDPASKPKEPAAAWADLWKEFSGEKAMEHVRAQVAFGPRPSGTATLEKARGHIAGTLRAAGWEVERQEFEHAVELGQGTIKYVNVIGRFPAAPGQPAVATTQRAIVCSHYDTKRMPEIQFVGANDAGSSTGALLELARVLATVPDLARQVELVFFDGEEAVVEFSPDPLVGPDGLVGSRHYATKLRSGGRARQFKFAVLWDMIGEKDIVLTIPSDTPRELSGGFITASEALGYRRHIGFHRSPILDDHVPLERIARIPSIDLIDLDYPHWHSVGDSLDKLSPDSIKIVAQMTIWYLARELAK